MESASPTLLTFLIHYLCRMAHEIISNFDNESAENFLADMSVNGYGLIAVSLEKITDSDGRPDIIECEEAIVACEIIAALVGKPAHDFPPDLNEWIDMFLPVASEPRNEVSALTNKAADAIDLLVTDSELRELWEDTPDFDLWFETQVDLQKRILN